MRLFRTTMAAIAVLALTATMAFAGRDEPMPEAAGMGLDTAGSASGQSVPMSAPDESGGEGDAEAEAQVSEVDGEHCIAPDSDEATEGGDGTGGDSEPAVENGDEPNHGTIVCGAARFGDAEDSGCANHGQYVRSFANKNFEGDPGICEDAEADAGAETTPQANGNGNGTANGPGQANSGRGGPPAWAGAAAVSGGGGGRGQGRP